MGWLVLPQLLCSILLTAGAVLAKPSQFEAFRLPYAPAPAPHGPHKHPHHDGKQSAWPWALSAPAPGPEIEDGHRGHRHHEDGTEHREGAMGPHDDHHDGEHHDDKGERSPAHKHEGDRESREPRADLLFFIPASEASFPANNSLVLSGVTSAIAYNGAGGRAGVVPTTAFVNRTAGSRYVAPDGTWLHSPVAALFGNAGPYGNEALLVSLRDPVYEPSIQMITFNATVLPPIEASLTTREGVTAELVNQAFYEARPVTQTVSAGTMWSNIGLFIDVNRAELHGRRAEDYSMKPVANGG